MRKRRRNKKRALGPSRPDARYGADFDEVCAQQRRRIAERLELPTARRSVFVGLVRAADPEVHEPRAADDAREASDWALEEQGGFELRRRSSEGGEKNEPSARYSRRSSEPLPPSTSWWIGLSREQLTKEANARRAVMSARSHSYGSSGRFKSGGALGEWRRQQRARERARGGKKPRAWPFDLQRDLTKFCAEGYDVVPPEVVSPMGDGYRPHALEDASRPGIQAAVTLASQRKVFERIVHTEKRRQAWALLPETFSFRSGLRRLQRVMTERAFRTFIAELEAEEFLGRARDGRFFKRGAGAERAPKRAAA